MVSEEIQKFLRENASKGGKKTAEKGKEYYSTIGKMGAKAKKKKKLEKRIQKNPRSLPLGPKSHGTGGLDRVRHKVRIRDNHTCQSCKKVWEEGQRRFDVHHLDESMESKRDINYDRNNQDKMITLCHKCHLSLPHVKAKMQGKRDLLTVTPTASLQNK